MLKNVSLIRDLKRSEEAAKTDGRITSHSSKASHPGIVAFAVLKHRLARSLCLPRWRSSLYISYVILYET